MSLLLAAAAATATANLPDIAISASVRAREVRVEQQGRASARVTAEPSAGERVEVTRNLPKGQARYRNLQIDLDVEAQLADPQAPASASTTHSRTTPTPQTGDRP